MVMCGIHNLSDTPQGRDRNQSRVHCWRARFHGCYASHPTGIGTLVGQRYDKIIVAG